MANNPVNEFDNVVAELLGDGKVSNMFKAMDKYGARVFKTTISTKNDKPLRMIILIDGEEECTEIAKAIDEVEAKWD